MHAVLLRADFQLEYEPWHAQRKRVYFVADLVDITEPIERHFTHVESQHYHTTARVKLSYAVDAPTSAQLTA